MLAREQNGQTGKCVTTYQDYAPEFSSLELEE